MSEVPASRPTPPPIPQQLDALWVEVVEEVSRSLDAPLVPVECTPPPPATTGGVEGDDEPPTNPEIVLGWVGSNKVTAQILALWLAAAFASSFITWLLFR